MAHVGAVRVPVLVYQPFPLGGVCVSCADVLRLQMLQLAVDVVAVSHFCRSAVKPLRKTKKNKVQLQILLMSKKSSAFKLKRKI